MKVLDRATVKSILDTAVEIGWQTLKHLCESHQQLQTEHDHMLVVLRRFSSDLQETIGRIGPYPPEGKPARKKTAGARPRRRTRSRKTRPNVAIIQAIRETLCENPGEFTNSSLREKMKEMNPAWDFDQKQIESQLYRVLEKAGEIKKVRGGEPGVETVWVLATVEDRKALQQAPSKHVRGMLTGTVRTILSDGKEHTTTQLAEECKTRGVPTNSKTFDQVVRNAARRVGATRTEKGWKKA